MRNEMSESPVSLHLTDNELMHFPRIGFDAENFLYLPIKFIFCYLPEVYLPFEPGQTLFPKRSQTLFAIMLYEIHIPAVDYHAPEIKDDGLDGDFFCHCVI